MDTVTLTSRLLSHFLRTLPGEFTFEQFLTERGTAVGSLEPEQGDYEKWLKSSVMGHLEWIYSYGHFGDKYAPALQAEVDPARLFRNLERVCLAKLGNMPRSHPQFKSTLMCAKGFETLANSLEVGLI